MAKTDAGRRLTEQHRLQQLGLRAATIRDLLTIWPTWNLGNKESYERLVQMAVVLINMRGQQSAQLAAKYFELFQAAEASTIAVTTPPVLATTATVAAIRTSLDATAQAGVMQSLRAGKTQQLAMRDGYIRASGAVSRHVLDQGRDTIIGSARREKRFSGWARVTSSKPCAFCSMLASRGPVYWKQSTAGFQAHDHCVVGETLVNGPSFELGFRRWYKGELVVIGTADGHKLRITPNHPVLTQRGWVLAGFLEIGDQVTQRPHIKRNALLVPDEQQTPSPIKDVWSALRVDGLVSMPVATKDFHGDGLGTKGEVDIVSADGFLPGEGNALFCECGRQVIGSTARAATVTNLLPGAGDTALVQLGVAFSTSRLVGGGGQCGTLVSRQRTPVDDGCISNAAGFDSTLSQPAAHDITRNAVSSGERLYGFTGQKRIYQTDGSMAQNTGRLVGTRARFDPPANHSDPEVLSVHAQLGRDLLERLSGGVEFSRISHLDRIEHSGHVYNLQTVEGWYEANGTIISNCSCTVEPHQEGSEWPGIGKQLREQWNETTKGLSGNDALNAFRRSLGTPSE